jgi:hypothetical protein
MDVVEESIHIIEKLDLRVDSVCVVYNRSSMGAEGFLKETLVNKWSSTTNVSSSLPKLETKVVGEVRKGMTTVLAVVSLFNVDIKGVMGPAGKVAAREITIELLKKRSIRLVRDQLVFELVTMSLI